jgi:hypothetical protein
MAKRKHSAGGAKTHSSKQTPRKRSKAAPGRRLGGRPSRTSREGNVISQSGVAPARLMVDASHAGNKPSSEGSRMARAGAAVTEAADRRLQNTTRRNIEMLVAGGPKISGRFLEVGHILTEMASDVLRSGVETAQDLIRCRNVGDIVQVQAEWIRRSFAVFFSRGPRLSEITTGLAFEQLRGLSVPAAMRPDS